MRKKTRSASSTSSKKMSRSHDEIALIEGSRNKKIVSLWFGIPNKKMRKRSASSTSSKKMSRSHDETALIEVKDIKKCTSNDGVFHLSFTKIKEIIDIIRSRKTPTFETYVQWDEYAISFYLKMCLCFGVDYQHLEDTSNDDEDGKKPLPLKEQQLEVTDDHDKKGKKPFKEQEVHRESIGVNQPSTEEITDDEIEEGLEEICCRRWIKGPFDFGSYSSSGATKADCTIPYHLYLLVKEAVDIMNNDTNDLTDLIIVEKKIRFFCNYFHSHLPTGWNYERKNASSLIANYDTTREPRYRMVGYTPTRVYESLSYDVDSGATPYGIADLMNTIYSRKTPSFWKMCSERISFYCKLCSCIGIKDYHRLEAASEDDVCLMNVGGKPRY